MSRLSLLALLVAAPVAAAPLAYTPDGRTLVVASGAHLALYSPPTTAEPVLLRAHLGQIHAVAVSADGKRVLSAGADGLVRVWDPKTWKEVATFRGYTGPVYAVALSPDGTIAATDATEGPVHTVRLWDVATGAERLKLGPMPGGAGALCFSADGRHLFTTSVFSDDRVRAMRGSMVGGVVRRLDAATGKSTEFPAVRGTSIAVTRDQFAVGDDRLSQELFLQAGRGGGGRVADQMTATLFTPAGEERAKISNAGSDVGFSPDGLLLVVHETASGRGPGGGMRINYQGRGAVLADALTGAELRLESALVYGAAFSPDGRTLAVPDDSPKRVRFIDLVPAVRKEFAADPVAAWKGLAAEDAKEAYEALWALVGHGPKGVALIAEQLPPAAGLTADAIAKFVAALDAPKFADREAAMKALREAGRAAVPALKAVVAKPPSDEVRARAEKLLESVVVGPPRDAPGRRAARAVGVLERIGTPAARDRLAKLAAGSPGHPLTEDAAAALMRVRLRVAD